MRELFITGETSRRRGCALTFEHRYPPRVHAVTLDRRTSVTMLGRAGETRRQLGDRAEHRLKLALAELQAGDRVRLSDAFRAQVASVAFYRMDDMALIRPDFRGRVLKVHENGRAVVHHAPEDCGCNFAAGTVSSGGVRCRRCDGTGTATERTLPVTRLEPETP